MSPRPAPSRIALLRGLAAGLAVGLALGAPVAAEAQGARGGLGASMVILQPVSSAVVQSSPVTVSRSGQLSLATSTPVSGPTSQIVMVEVSDDDAARRTAPLSLGMRSGGTTRALAAGVPTPVGRDGTAPAAGRDSSFRVAYEVRGAPRDGDQAAVRLRVRYLAVPAT